MKEPRRSFYACIAGAFALCAGAAEASPWARAPGELFVSTRTEYFEASSDETPSGALAPPYFHRTDTTLYVEWGLIRRLTVGGKAAYGASEAFDGFGATSGRGVSEAEMFVQYEFLRSTVDAASLRIAGAAPARLGSGARPQTLSDGAEVEARALYGRNLLLRPFKVYAAVEAGYRRNFGEAADEIRGDALIGVEPAKRLLLLGEVFSTTSLRNAGPGGAEFDVVKLQPSIVYRWTDRIAMQGGVTFETFGRNLTLGESYFLGVWATF